MQAQVLAGGSSPRRGSMLPIVIAAVVLVGMFMVYLSYQSSQTTATEETGGGAGTEADVVWTAEMVTANATTLSTQAAVLDVAETEGLVMQTTFAQDHRTAMRMHLATLLSITTAQFNKCYERPGGNGHDHTVILEFPEPNPWGDVTQFLFNVANPINSTFLSQKAGHVTTDFIEIPCNNKYASKGYQYLKSLLDTLLNMGKIPFWPG